MGRHRFNKREHIEKSNIIFESLDPGLTVYSDSLIISAIPAFSSVTPFSVSWQCKATGQLACRNIPNMNAIAR